MPFIVDALRTVMRPAPGQDQLGAAQSLEWSVMYLIGVVVATVISGFALYRGWMGNQLGAVINAAFVLSVLGVLWLGRWVRLRPLAMNLFGATISGACLMSALLVSSNGLLWAMLVLLINALVLSRFWSVCFNTLVIVVLALSTHLYESSLHQFTWTAVALLMTGFGLLFTAQLREQRRLLSFQATIDPLTGVGNRRLMQQHLEEIVAERRKDQRSSTLMVLDLDMFKQVNDRHGHEMGDQVLREFAAGIAGALREADGCYRMGGEEFVVLLRGMDYDIARQELPDLHARLSGRVSTPDGPIRFSAGAAALRDGEDWSRWLARADQALYVAKGAGRDQLAFSSP